MNFYSCVTALCACLVVAAIGTKYVEKLSPAPKKPGTAECGLMVPPPDTLHQRVLERCVSCHLEEGVIR